MSPELVSAAEVARILGVSRQRVARLPRVSRVNGSGAGPASKPGPLCTRTAAHAARDRSFPTGEPAPGLGQVLALAGAQARELNHQWIGDVHLLLALLHPECPGAARRVLRSFGVSLEEVRRAYVDSMGDPFEPSTEWPGTTVHDHALFERAILKAVELRDEEINSEHLLLALADDWGRSQPSAYLAGHGLDAQTIRERVIAFTEEASPAKEPPAPQPASVPPSAKRIVRPPEPEYAPAPNGRDPRRRRPWGSAVFHDAEGKPVTQGIALRQYLIDHDGNPVLTTDGLPVHLLIDESGHNILDESGQPILVPVDVPAGSAIKRAERNP